MAQVASGVHSANDTSATRSGFTQCSTPAARFDHRLCLVDPVSNGDRSISMGCNCSFSARAVSSVQPVPTAPAKRMTPSGKASAQQRVASEAPAGASGAGTSAIAAGASGTMTQDRPAR